jgi:hypothetical protein
MATGSPLTPMARCRAQSMACLYLSCLRRRRRRSLWGSRHTPLRFRGSDVAKLQAVGGAAKGPKLEMSFTPYCCVFAI